MGRAYQGDRLEDVFTAFAAMAPREQIVRQLAQKWGIRARTVKRYITEAERILAARAADPQALEERREHLAQAAILLYRKQLSAQHYSSARRTLDMLAGWYGIGTPQLTTAIHLHAPNGALTSREAIEEQMRLIEAEKEARAQSLAKQIAGQFSASTTEDDGGDDGSGV